MKAALKRDECRSRQTSRQLPMADGRPRSGIAFRFFRPILPFIAEMPCCFIVAPLLRKYEFDSATSSDRFHNAFPTQCVPLQVVAF
jgi:hypothetical protein